MIQPSPTARRTDPTASPIGGSSTDSRKLHENRRDYEASRKKRPMCRTCGYPCNYRQANKKHPQCEGCRKKETDRRVAAVQERHSAHAENTPRVTAEGKPDLRRGKKLPGLRAIRKSRNLSQRALAELAGISDTTVRTIEAGARPESRAVRTGRADDRTVARLVEALGVQESELES